jgi:glycosyltransferase involved in cell wall biosynthesis
MVLRYAARRPDVRLRLIDTAPRWRSIHDTATWKRAFGGSLQLARDMCRLLWVLVAWRPAAIHLTTSGQLSVVRDVLTAALSRACGVRVLYHVRFGRIPQIAAGGTREWRLMRVAMRLASVVVVLDRRSEEAIRHHAREVNVTIIPNFAHPEELAAATSAACAESRTVTYLGWVIPTKGIGELIEAWERVRAPGWRLRIVGPAEPEYARALARSSAAGSIDFSGELSHDEAMAAVAAAGVFVLPSHTEGFPNVVVEAMMLGRPIVATAVGAVPEMLDADAGIVVPPRDVGALAAAIERVTGDEVLRARLGLAARRRAFERYSIGAVFERYMHEWRGRPLETSAERRAA